MTKKCCIFDLDGTLADTVDSMAFCCNRVLEEAGLAPHPAENYKRYAGDGAANLVKRALAEAGDKDLACFDRAYAFYRELFKKYCMYHVTPYEGIPETVQAMKAQGVKLAVLSNKPHLRAGEVIRDLFGDGLFDYVQGMVDGQPGKPDPAGVYRILEQFGCDTADCLYVGDTNTDMLTGKNAGLYTVGVTWGFRDEKELVDAGADVIIDAPGELLGL